MVELKKLFSFGLVADVQYSDMDNSNTEGRTQRYREAPAKLEQAVQHWLANSGKLSFVLNLGDIINGNKDHPDQNEPELEQIASIFNRLKPKIPVYHAIGNHCLSVNRDLLLKRLKLPSSFYRVELEHKWNLLVLDTTEMSGHSNYPPDSDAVKQAEAFRKAHPLSESNPQMSPWNGGISSEQLRWLQSELDRACELGEHVLLAAHHQAGQGGARATHLAWNWRDIQAALTASAAAKLYLAGHDHMGGYSQHLGVHWLTLEGLLEAPSKGNAFAVAHVFQDRIVIEGHGVTSRVLCLG